MKLDKITQDRIKLLHPIWRTQVAEAIAEANESLALGNMQVRIVQGLRTFEEQDALFIKRPKVTNAKGGQSLHNYGLAIDFALLINGNEISWDTKKDFDHDNQADWVEVVRAFTKRGYVWGSSFGDYPHIGAVKEGEWKNLLVRYKAKNFIPDTTYVVL